MPSCSWQSFEIKTSSWGWELCGREGIGGRFHHSRLVPDAGGDVLNETGPTSILNEPSWSRDPLPVSFSVPMGTAMECWGAAVEGVSGLSRGRRGGTKMWGQKERPQTTCTNKPCGKARPWEWGPWHSGCLCELPKKGLLCEEWKGKGLPWGQGKILVKSKKPGRRCCVEANGSKDKPVMLKSWISLLSQCKALVFTRTALLTSKTKPEGVMRNRARKWKLRPSTFGHP